VITEAPVDTELVPYVDVVFPCAAKTDPSTPLTRRWYYNDKLVANDSVMFVASNGSLVVRLSQVDQGGTHLAGIFLCHVSNGYSTDDAYASLYPFGAERTYIQYNHFASIVNCVLGEHKVLHPAVNLNSEGVEDRSDTPCPRGVDSSSQHLLRGESISRTQGVSGFWPKLSLQGRRSKSTVRKI